MWGALIQAAQAYAHRSQPNYHPKSRTGIINALNLASPPGGAQFRLHQAVNAAARISATASTCPAKSSPNNTGRQ